MRDSAAGITRPFLIPTADFLVLASSSALSLRSLTLETFAHHDHLLLPTLPNLDRLLWTHSRDRDRLDFVGELSETRIVLRARTILSSLPIRHLALNFPLEPVNILDHLDFLPPTLETFRTYPPPPDELARFLDSGRCASRKQIELIAEGKSEGLRSEEEDPSWRAWTPWTVAKVLAAYRRRGLRVWLPRGELIWRLG